MQFSQEFEKLVTLEVSIKGNSVRLLHSCHVLEKISIPDEFRSLSIFFRLVALRNAAFKNVPKPLVEVFVQPSGVCLISTNCSALGLYCNII